MAVDALHHINIHTADAEQSRDFYVRVIGLRVGDRPPLTSAGYWLTCAISLRFISSRSVRKSDPKQGPARSITLPSEGSMLTRPRQTLATAGVPYREVVVPPDKTVRPLFVHDPNGVRIELNFDPPNV